MQLDDVSRPAIEWSDSTVLMGNMHFLTTASKQLLDRLSRHSCRPLLFIALHVRLPLNHLLTHSHARTHARTDVSLIGLHL